MFLFCILIELTLYKSTSIARSWANEHLDWAKSMKCVCVCLHVVSVSAGGQHHPVGSSCLFSCPDYMKWISDTPDTLMGVSQTRCPLISLEGQSWVGRGRLEKWCEGWLQAWTGGLRPLSSLAITSVYLHSRPSLVSPAPSPLLSSAINPPPGYYLLLSVNIDTSVGDELIFIFSEWINLNQNRNNMVRANNTCLNALLNICFRAKCKSISHTCVFNTYKHTKIYPCKPVFVHYRLHLLHFSSLHWKCDCF